MSDDLTDAARRVLAGGSAAQVFVEQSIAAAQLPAAAHAFISTSFTAAREAAALADRRVASRADPGPLAGLAVSIKDLFDVAGEVTSAGSRLLASAPPAAA
ncbi:MAG TPA: amidase family protein, partial [Caldimonas sp.]